MTGEDGIDPANKELYLADDEFLSTFEIDKETYQVRLCDMLQDPAPDPAAEFCLRAEVPCEARSSQGLLKFEAAHA